MIPTVASTLAYQNLGSEKLIDLIEEIAHDGSNSAFRRLLCGFILLELDALSGFNMIESLSDEITEKWFVHIVTQRLFQYYSTRPLSSSLRGRFEELVSKLEIRLRGRKPQAKDQVLVELKKHVFLEKRKQRASGSALQEKAVSKQGGAPR
jgi:hypothetical protein